jgi:hypothetical protein
MHIITNSPLQGSWRGVITVAIRLQILSEVSLLKAIQAYFQITTESLIQYNTLHGLIRNAHGAGGTGELLEQVGGVVVGAALHHFQQ